MITVGANLAARLAVGSGSKPVLLIDLDLSTGHRRFAVWHHDVVYGGNTYFANPPINQADALETAQSTPLTGQAIRFAVQGDASLLTDLLQNSRGRWAHGYVVELVDGAPVDDEAIYLWRRRMAPGETFSDATTDYVDLNLESRFHRNRNTAVATYSHAWQQQVDATDFCLIDSGKSFDISRPDFVQKSGIPKP